MSFDTWNQGCPYLVIEQLCLFLHQGRHSLFHLFLNDLGECSLDGLCNGLLNLNLQILLSLDLLLQAVHLHMELRKLLIQLLVILNDLVLLLLLCGWHRHSCSSSDSGSLLLLSQLLLLLLLVLADFSVFLRR